MHPFHNKSPLCCISSLPDKGNRAFPYKKDADTLAYSFPLYTCMWMAGRVRWLGARSVFMHVPVRSLRGIEAEAQWSQRIKTERACSLCLPSFSGLHKTGRCGHADAAAAGGGSRFVKPKGRSRCVHVCAWRERERERERTLWGNS